MELPIRQTTVAVVGATGRLARTCAQFWPGMLDGAVVGRHMRRRRLREQWPGRARGSCRQHRHQASMTRFDSWRLTSAVHRVIERRPQPGAVVCVVRVLVTSRGVWLPSATTCW